MRRTVFLSFFLPLLLLHLSCDEPEECTDGSCAPELCDADAIREALVNASPGDTVTIGVCSVIGPLDVPVGVTLTGRGPSSTMIEAGEGGYGVRLMPGTEGVTTLSRLAVMGRASGAGAVAVFSAGEGVGAVRIESVEVDVETGVGVGLVGIRTASITSLTLTGPVEAGTGDDAVFARVEPIGPAAAIVPGGAECMAITPECTPDERRMEPGPSGGELAQFCDACGRWTSITGTEGLWIENVATATASALTVRSFARHGLLYTAEDPSSTFVLSSATFEDNAGAGMRADGGDVTIDDSVFRRMQPSAGSEPSVALFGSATGTGSGTLVTNGLEVTDNAGLGILQSSSGGHDRLVANMNMLPALWTGGVDGLVVSNATFEGNGVAGIVLTSSAGVEISDSTVLRTRSIVVSSGGTELPVGDGLVIMGSLERIAVSRTRFEDNERVGIVFDMGETVVGDVDSCMGGDGVCFSEVTVTGADAQNGAIAIDQRTMIDEDVWMGSNVGSGLWDMGITREGSTLRTDTPGMIPELNLTGAVIPIQTPVPTNLRGAVIPII